MQSKKNKFIFVGLGVIIFIGIIFFYFKNKNHSVTMDDRINISVSFYPLYFLAYHLGGDLVQVTNLTPVGLEPHEYELTTKDVVKIKQSKVLFLNGGGLESWSGDIKKDAKMGWPAIVILGEDLTRLKINTEEEDKNDPHIWLSPILMIKMAEKISAELIKIDPKNKEYYQLNLDVLKSKLINLDSSFRAGLTNCQKKEFFTSHSAFGYLTNEYGLTQIPIAGISPEEEPSSRQLAQVVEIARSKQAKYIFFESLASPKLSETLAKEVGAQTLVLNPIEGLTEKEIKQGKNYLTEMETNLENLKIALECE